MQAYGYFLQMLKLCLSTLVDGLEIPQHTQPSTYQPIQVRNKIKLKHMHRGICGT